MFRVQKDLREARKQQLRLRQRIKIIPLGKKPRFIAGTDAAFIGEYVIGTSCLYSYPELVPVEDTYAVTKITFPYIPGYLSFREGNVLLSALGKLSRRPDLILFDGQGIAHPGGLGIASHLGVLLKIPSIGCAKSRLIGDYREPGKQKGHYTSLRFKSRTVGAVLRTRDAVRPLFISPGHLITLKESIHFVLGCTGRFRIPEPLRRADHLSKQLKRKAHLSLMEQT